MELLYLGGKLLHLRSLGFDAICQKQREGGREREKERERERVRASEREKYIHIYIDM
jgi:hypothetical protein